MASLPAASAAPLFVHVAQGRPTPRQRRNASVVCLAIGLIMAILVVWSRMAPAPPVQSPALKPQASSQMTAVMAAPLVYKPLSSLDAQALNATRPLASRPLEVARPFLLLAAPMDWEQAVNCLALANYYEAASEGDRGMRAVSQVVLNRVRHPIFPHSVCGVVFQGAERPTGCQFTFACDGSMRRLPRPDLFARARAIAEAALNGRVDASVGMATHYHANFVVPYWADSLDKVRTIGTHIFYTWRGPAGNRASFQAVYAGEPQDGTFDAAGARPVSSPKEEEGYATSLASAAKRITLDGRAQGNAAPERTYLVADEGASTLKADSDAAAGTLRAQPLVASTVERVKSDER